VRRRAALSSDVNLRQERAMPSIPVEVPKVRPRVSRALFTIAIAAILSFPDVGVAQTSTTGAIAGRVLNQGRLLTANRYDRNTSQILYDVPTGFGETRGSSLLLQFQAQLGIRYRL
jgi:hypothetical protein